MPDHRGGQRLIEPIPTGPPGRWDDIEALRVHLAWLGCDVSRDDALEAAAASALFDVHYSERWFGDAAISACSGDLLGEICDALGCEHEWIVGRPFSETWGTLAERVQRGEPTVVGGMLPGELPRTSRCGDYHLFVGYESTDGDATAALCGHGPASAFLWTRLPGANGRPRDWQARVRCLAVAPNVWASRPMLTVGPRVRPSRLGTPELALTNLRRAALAARRQDGPIGYWRLWGGLRAIQQWVHDIEYYPQEVELKPEHERGFPLTNITLSLSAELESRRRRAARYLRDVRHLFPRNAKVALCDAATHSETSARLLVEFREVLFGNGHADDQEETARRNLLKRPVRLSAAVLLRQVAAEEEAMTFSLETVCGIAGPRPVR